MDDQRTLQSARELIVKAMESRRELVAYSKLEAIEMDRRAREVERAALDELRKLLSDSSGHQQLHQVKTKLMRMDETLDELARRQDIQERSRTLERDDITWRTFEDISWLLGVL